jgi:hypothetical protein
MTTVRLPPSFAQVLRRRPKPRHGDFSFCWFPAQPAGPYGEGADLRPAQSLVRAGTWTAELDSFLVGLVKDYGPFAPSVFTALRGESFDWLAEAAVKCPPIRWSLHSRFPVDDWIGPVAALAFSRMMHLVTWARPDEQQCPLCGTGFDPGDLDPRWHVISYGPPRWCPSCCGVGWGVTPESRSEALAAIGHYALVYETPPPANWYRAGIPPRLPAEQRDELMAGRMAMPHFESLRDAGLRPWTAVLEEAGVLDDGKHRAGRGVMSRAADGHWCRSLMERAVDDFFHSSGIAHEPEPAWPAHPKLNPRGLKRADWRLPDGTMVEAAGLLTDAGYESRMNAKRELASELGVPLIVLVPADLLRLDIVFSRWHTAR